MVQEGVRGVKHRRSRGPRHGGWDEDEHIRNESLAMLPAWAFEKILTEALKQQHDDHNVLEPVFPPDTPLVDMWSSFPPYKHLTVQDALTSLFPQWQRRVLGEDGSDSVPHPRYRRFPIGPHEKKVAYQTASFLFQHQRGWQVAAYVTLEVVGPAEGEKSIIQLTSPAGCREVTIGKMNEIEAYVEEHNCLKGHKLDANGRFLRLVREYTWDCVYAAPKLLATIRRNTQGFLDRLEMYRRYRLPTRRGVLLHGRPGTGKTLIGKILCSQLRGTFIWVRPGNVCNVGCITSVFEMARDLSPSLVFFEDLDLFGAKRNFHGFGGLILGELLNQMDGLKENDGIVVVATTNDLESIEPALKDRPSRFDCVLEVPEINDGIRHNYLRTFLVERSIKPSFFDEMDKATTRCRTIAEVQEEAIRCLQRAIENDIDPTTIGSPFDLPTLAEADHAGSGSGGIGFHASQG